MQEKVIAMINFISTSFLLFLLLIGHDCSTCRCLFFTICTTKSASSHVISTSHSNTSSTTYNYVYSPFASYSPLKCFHHHFFHNSHPSGYQSVQHSALQDCQPNWPSGIQPSTCIVCHLRSATNTCSHVTPLP